LEKLLLAITSNLLWPSGCSTIHLLKGLAAVVTSVPQYADLMAVLTLSAPATDVGESQYYHLPVSISCFGWTSRLSVKRNRSPSAYSGLRFQEDKGCNYEE